MQLTKLVYTVQLTFNVPAYLQSAVLDLTDCRLIQSMTFANHLFLLQTLPQCNTEPSLWMDHQHGWTSTLAVLSDQIHIMQMSLMLKLFRQIKVGLGASLSTYVSVRRVTLMYRIDE